MNVGDRVQVKADHWTGIGARTGTIRVVGRDRFLVMFDDDVLIDISQDAMEPA